jgi:hypothetical protein
MGILWAMDAASQDRFLEMMMEMSDGGLLD